jgi:hypothetical protein
VARGSSFTYVVTILAAGVVTIAATAACGGSVDGSTPTPPGDPQAAEKATCGDYANRLHELCHGAEGNVGDVCLGRYRVTACRSQLDAFHACMRTVSLCPVGEGPSRSTECSAETDSLSKCETANAPPPSCPVGSTLINSESGDSCKFSDLVCTTTVAASCSKDGKGAVSCSCFVNGLPKGSCQATALSDGCAKSGCCSRYVP